MKLLALVQGYPSAVNPISGAFHKHQMATLARLDCDITLVAPVPWVPRALAARNPRWAAYANQPLEQTDGPVRILRPRYLAIPRENRFGLPHLAQFSAISRLNLPKPDLIHAFFALPTGLVARQLANRWSVPYLVSLLGDDVTIYPYFGARTLARFQTALLNATTIIANGPELATQARHLSGIPAEILSIGVDFTRFDGLPSKAEARQALGLPSDNILVLFVGGLVASKGMTELNEAIRRLANPCLRLVCVGDGPERARMEANAATICVGAQPVERVPLYMKAADLLVLPSHHEGLPTAIIEAGGAGLPVLGSDVGGVTDLLKQERGFVHRVKDVASLTEMLANSLKNPTEMTLRAQRLTDFVHQHHDIKRNCRRLTELYSQALAAYH